MPSRFARGISMLLFIATDYHSCCFVTVGGGYCCSISGGGDVVVIAVGVGVGVGVAVPPVIIFLLSDVDAIIHP